MRQRVLMVDTLNSCFYLKHAGETSVMWRFLSDIRTVAERFKVDRVIFVYEGKGGSTYRKALYPDYKKKRKELREKSTPAEKLAYKFFIENVEELIKIAPTFGIKTINVDGAEADDTIAYLINNMDPSKYQIMLLSSDTDLNQLLRPGVVQGTYGKDMASGIAQGNIPAGLWMSFDDFCKETEILPTEYARAKSISGDTSDSIVGFEGIGAKLANALIKKYRRFRTIKENLDCLDIPRLPKRGVEHMKRDFDLVYRNYELINLNWDQTKFTEILGEDGVEELNNFISEIPTPEQVDREVIRELCYEYGRIDIADKLDFWLHAFCR